jgi:hypothetical protein
MDGHEAEAVGQLLLDEIEQVLGIQFGRVARLAGGLNSGSSLAGLRVWRVVSLKAW